MYRFRDRRNAFYCRRNHRPSIIWGPKRERKREKERERERERERRADTFLMATAGFLQRNKITPTERETERSREMERNREEEDKSRSGIETKTI